MPKTCFRFHPFHRPRRPLGRVGYSPTLFLDLSTRRGWGVSVTPWPTPGKDPVPIVQEAGSDTGLVWTGAKNLAPTGIWSPDRSTCSQSLYRLSYLAHPKHVVTKIKKLNKVTLSWLLIYIAIQCTEPWTQKSVPSYSPLYILWHFSEAHFF
jgi:hypothetical protein